MQIKTELCTDGVLVIASKNRLQEYFGENEFNYDYPDGLLPLLNAGIACPITTESGEEVEVTLSVDAGVEREGFEAVGKCKMFIGEDDSLYVFGHADFTQICDWHKGDIDKFEFHDEPIFINELPTGWYLIDIFTAIVDEDELDEDTLDSGEYSEIQFIFELMSQEDEPADLGGYESVFAV